MKRSMDRILTTHAGSLPQPDDLRQMHAAKNSGQPSDRLVRYAKLVGRENVMAGTDAGLGREWEIRRSPGQSSRQWPKARGLPHSNCGANEASVLSPEIGESRE
jgi:hypothetical protein